MRNRLKNINFYLTSLALGSEIDNLVDSGSFVVKDTTVNWFSLSDWNQIFFVVIDADQTLKREIFRITNVNIATKTLTFDKRISPNWKQTHEENALVQINDVAELFNYISSHIDDAWYTEVVSWRDVKFYWWVFKFEDVNVTVSDSTFTLNPNTTNYIIMDYDDNTVKVVTSLTWINYYLFATWVTDWSDVLSLTDNRAVFLWVDTSLITPSISIWNTTTLDAWSSATVTNTWTSLEPVFNFWIPKWDTWDIWNPWEDWQTITDNITTTWVVTTDNSTYIKITYDNWTYDYYTLDWIATYDANWNQLWQKLLTVWTFEATWINYASWWFINKATWTITYVWSPAYRNKQNTFEYQNTFNAPVIFNSSVWFPYYVLPSASWNFTFDNNDWDFQWITITWASDHICTFNNLVAWIKSFFVVQSWTGKLDFAIWTWNWTVTNTYIIWDSYDNTVALDAWVHFFTIAVASTWAHILYTWKSLLHN